MAWYWWVLIAAGAVAFAVVKSVAVKRFLSRKKRKEEEAVEED